MTTHDGFIGSDRRWGDMDDWIRVIGLVALTPLAGIALSLLAASWAPTAPAGNAVDWFGNVELSRPVH